MAWVFDRYVKDRSLYPLQERARAQRLGLWADVNPMPPWEWRAAKGELEHRARK
jgi:micrococcal nuclease